MDYGAIDCVDVDLLRCGLLVRFFLVRASSNVSFPWKGKADASYVFFRGFVIVGSFLPKFLAERGAATELSVYDTYRN